MPTGEGQSYNPDKEISRRDFIKLGAVAAISAAGLGMEGCADKSEMVLQESTPTEFTIKQNDTQWSLFEASGWNDGSIDFDYFRTALKELNKSNKKVNIDNLQPNDTVVVPVRKGKQD